MAMFLKLEASDPISTKIQSTPGIPDFMDWNQITALPAWEPFHSLPFAGGRDRGAHVLAC
jgi:urea transport system permease protein